MSCLYEMQLHTESVLDMGGLEGISAYQSMHNNASRKMKRSMAGKAFR
jgi:hypothetical protein